MTCRLTNAGLVVEAEFHDESVDILSVHNLAGSPAVLTESELDAVTDDLLRGKFES